MKKIGLLMSLASVLVVGGVYATWSYSQGAVASATDDYAVVMTAETISGEKGSFNVSSTSVTFEIENLAGDYHPVLQGAGYVDVVFTPSVGADTSVVENGIDIKWSLSISEDGATNWKYDPDFAGGADTVLFTVDGSETTISKTVADKTTQVGRFIYQIPVSEILTKITMNVADDFVLDTKAKYDAFNSWIDDYKFVLTISEA